LCLNPKENKEMDNKTDKTNEYIEQMSSKESELLNTITRQTYLKQVYPKMISGKTQGLFLKMVSCMMQPKRILEIGTFTAYSAICLAQGLCDDGKLFTIEKNEELEDVIVEHLKKAGVSHKTQLIIGDALDIIPSIDEIFDLVFIDADKEYYIEYLELVLPKLRKNGIVLADNVLWSGKVLENICKKDKETEGIKRFNEHVVKHDSLENVIIPLRDGISVIRKK
jgi:caffeoyl-CoA O-methyltransferase